MGRRDVAVGGRLDADRYNEPDLEALLAVLSVASLLTMRGDAELRRLGSSLRISEFDVLVAITMHGPLRPTEITHKASLAPSATSVSTILKRLEGRGFLTREPHADIGGAVIVSVTPAGARAIEEAFPAIERKVISWFGGHLSAAEMETSAELLGRF